MTPAAHPPGTGSWLRPREIGITPLFVLTILLLTFGGLMGIFVFILSSAHISDGVMETRNSDTVIGLALVFVFCTVASHYYGHRRSLMLQAVAERFGLRLRAEAMQAAIRNSVRRDLASGVTVLQDISAVQRFVSGGAVTGTLDMSAALVSLAFLFYLDAGSGWITLTGIAIIMLVAYVMKRTVAHLARDTDTKLDEASAQLSGQLLHPDVVRGLGQLPATMFRWQRRYDRALDSASKAQSRGNAIREIESIVSSLCLMALMLHGLLLIIENNGTIGLLISTYFLASHAMSPFSGLLTQWESWNSGARSWRRLKQVMTLDGEAPARPPEPDAPPGLLIDAVSFWPEGRERPIISGLTLALRPGAVVTVEGRNGVGKSTLLRLVLGLLEPTAGRILLNGQDTFFCDRGTLGARIGYLPQDVQLLEADIYTNIGRGPDAPPDLVVAAARAAGAHEMIGRMPLGYQTPSGTTAGLSAGQRRLVALARALYRDPELLVLDEPEVGLDGPARNALRAAVERTRLAGGVVLVVTHEPHTWNDVTDYRLKLGADGIWELAAAQREEGKEPHFATIG
ncbi:ATP-binding cassette domain-containing protein [Paeniroseomonas aquatica]|uniref:ATP-binding cassette domain-containing protein n=1 Tax=Paeniroseomonas aquatica TaxID=373043 RepID=A0ABT8A790_9PROT|nr:ATP-binding cassette domain-containing protein [Paeniroseomonas aquatica]MDN3565687.1 ATP-binding cassette domain-containing protein [Paeniroseomonas aquatica]